MLEASATTAAGATGVVDDDADNISGSGQGGGVCYLIEANRYIV